MKRLIFLLMIPALALGQIPSKGTKYKAPARITVTDTTVLTVQWDSAGGRLRIIGRVDAESLYADFADIDTALQDWVTQKVTADTLIADRLFLGVVTAANGKLTFGMEASDTIGMQRRTSGSFANWHGSLVIKAADVATTATNKYGGDLYLVAGNTRGSPALGTRIYFYTPTTASVIPGTENAPAEMGYVGKTGWLLKGGTTMRVSLYLGDEELSADSALTVEKGAHFKRGVLIDNKIEADTVTGDVGQFNALTSLQIGTGTSLTYLLADTSSFVGAATRKALYRPAVEAGDKIFLTLRAKDDETLPAADDIISGISKEDSVIVMRKAGTTADLKFSFQVIR